MAVSLGVAAAAAPLLVVLGGRRRFARRPGLAGRQGLAAAFALALLSGGAGPVQAQAAATGTWPGAGLPPETLGAGAALLLLGLAGLMRASGGGRRKLRR